jgi:hypothetical protein
MFYSTGDPTFNTNAPGGALAGSGWQWQGNWGAISGTPVAPDVFMTAKHAGGTVGDVFVFNGVTYTTTARYLDPASDLVLWRVNGIFPTHAPLYTGTNEVGLDAVLFGRGLQRGAEFRDTNGVLKGWGPGGDDLVRRWGENTVEAIVSAGPFGEQLYCLFDAGAGTNECHLNANDSGGGLFVWDDGMWKLAGVHFAIDGRFSSNNVTYTSANLFDARNVWVEGSTNNVLIADLGVPEPSGMYSTRVSSRISFWGAFVPEPATGVALLIAGLSPMARRRRR